jgi:hypothetical protein
VDHRRSGVAGCDRAAHRGAHGKRPARAVALAPPRVSRRCRRGPTGRRPHVARPRSGADRAPAVRRLESASQRAEGDGCARFAPTRRPPNETIV